MGPILIFDKSLLESLNPDEAMWLDQFFNSNVTPLFFIETLADLEKQVRKGRAAEDVVGSLAYKTPDMSSQVNTHHTALLSTEFAGHPIDMRNGRPIVSGGQRLQLGGRTGVIIRPSPEQEAFARWQRKQFLDLERSQAKEWRRQLSTLNFEETYQLFQRFFPLGKPRTFADLKRFTDFYIDSPDQEKVLRLGLALVGVPEQPQEDVVRTWKEKGSARVRQFAPYFSHVSSVELFFALGIAADLIGRGRPSHKIDVAYLYYLPFCMVFSSNDKLHAEIAPLFLRDNQSFVHGGELKADLAKLDRHYQALPDEVKVRGVSSFAHYPPHDVGFLVTRLWDKHMSPRWREPGPTPDSVNETELGKELAERIRRLKAEGKPAVVSEDADQLDELVIERRVHGTKGKWTRFPPEVMEKSGEADDD